MAKSLWQTLLRPDAEEKEDMDRAEVGRAANLLQVGEFQVLQLAYHEWHNEELPSSITDRVFHDYMIYGEVPHWARHYARQIIRLGDQDRLHEHDPRYHRYDHEYETHVPGGVRRFCIAVACITLFLGGGIIVANHAVKNPISLFPPYLDAEDVKPPPPSAGKN